MLRIYIDDIKEGFTWRGGISAHGSQIMHLLNNRSFCISHLHIGQHEGSGGRGERGAGTYYEQYALLEVLINQNLSSRPYYIMFLSPHL